ncbi:hypothetical protein GXP67_21225 [Rhodocytophaga rosea]|uniref:Uncharacterized protein n=1 Tax=Rhodocytophaga rosea TaxID=2704465 RepID=A0A6C0GN12_9BACT|nr:hypothetical protein [Rhodocytophaga rosea]QHT68992.1 hypothetical protein GXP67_21225 [Rhodocytophaga rosea]
MKIVNFFRELYPRNPLLAIAGWIHIGILLLCIAFMPFDNRLVMNINPWIKPAKFAISIAIFAWSMGWFMYELKTPARTRIYSILFTLFMGIEMLIIAFQAHRGTISHFNIRSAFDILLFNIMGIAITLNLLLTIVVLIEFFRIKSTLPNYMVWAIQLGLFSLILASIEGFVMVKYMAHTIGSADGGPGLPVLNWSTRTGDLRVAHFMGIHGLQILPFFAYLLSKWIQKKSYNIQNALVFSFAGFYLLLMNITFWQAINKIPLIRI